MANRITYTKLPVADDSKVARWDVLLDGEKIGTVVRTTRDEKNYTPVRRSDTPTDYECEAPNYCAHGSARGMREAVLDLLTSLGMGLDEAYAAVGMSRRSAWR